MKSIPRSYRLARQFTLAHLSQRAFKLRHRAASSQLPQRSPVLPRWAGGVIQVDGEEVVDAQWFSPGRLPPRLPTSFSIARRLVDDFLRRRGIAPSPDSTRG